MTPIFACGFGWWDVLLTLGPIGSCVAAFVGGAVCSHLGNKTLGGWTMGISAIAGFVSIVMLTLAVD